MGIAVLMQLAVYAKADWRQGISWGPRWLTDLLPILFWMLPPAVQALRAAGRALFIVGCCIGIGIEAIGAFWYTGQSAASLYDGADTQSALTKIWSFADAPFIAELHHALAPADIATYVQGSLDAITTLDGEVRQASTQGYITVAGWALANGRTPYSVLAMVDGKPVQSIQSFGSRLDVNETLQIVTRRLVAPAAEGNWAGYTHRLHSRTEQRAWRPSISDFATTAHSGESLGQQSCS